MLLSSAAEIPDNHYFNELQLNSIIFLSVGCMTFEYFVQFRFAVYFMAIKSHQVFKAPVLLQMI